MEDQLHALKSELQFPRLHSMTSKSNKNLADLLMSNEFSQPILY